MSTDEEPGRRATGQVLNRLLQHFRTELVALAGFELFPGVRFTHVHVFGNLGHRGIRLTDLAQRAQLGLAACSELVSDLEELGYVERRPDPSDRRAKLIAPTGSGAELLGSFAAAVTVVDEHWQSLIGEERFEAAMQSLDQLLATLDESRGAPATVDTP
jgi:DNA-binding MarR family transcriptional regulator